MHKWLFLYLSLISSGIAAINPINPFSEWEAPPTPQQLVTSSHKPTPMPPPPKHDQAAPSYEEIVVFSLQSAVAAFHVRTDTFSADHKSRQQYFSPEAFKQLEAALFPGNGTGICDTYIMTQKPLDAITRAPVSVTAKSPHTWEVTLPMILSNQQTLDLKLQISSAITASKKMLVTHFEISSDL